MYILIAIIVIIVALAALGLFYSVFKNKINFIISGLDAGFSISDILLLYKVAEICELEQPTSLYWSMPSLNKCMAQINTQASANGEVLSPKYQQLMTKLYNYRTKVQNDTDDKKGLTSTMSLDKGQKLRIILPGKGVFASEIVENGSQMVINVPRQKNMIPITAEEWVGKVISVYLWRKGDARYVFDTTVTQSGLYIGKPSLFLKHSNNLIRTQKRKAVRANCEIYAQLFILRKNQTDYSQVETQAGYKCLIMDISESGAMIKIGGKGLENIQIKLQFTINKMLIVMAGIVRTVDYNESENISILHFECIHTEQPMRNEILSFVYNTLPENEKEILEALEQTDEDNEEIENLLSGNAAENQNGEEKKPSEAPAENIMESLSNTSSESVTSDKKNNLNSTEELPSIDGNFLSNLDSFEKIEDLGDIDEV